MSAGSSLQVVATLCCPGCLWRWSIEMAVVPLLADAHHGLAHADHGLADADHGLADADADRGLADADHGLAASADADHGLAAWADADHGVAALAGADLGSEALADADADHGLAALADAHGAAIAEVPPWRQRPRRALPARRGGRDKSPSMAGIHRDGRAARIRAGVVPGSCRFKKRV